MGWITIYSQAELAELRKKISMAQFLVNPWQGRENFLAKNLTETLTVWHIFFNNSAIDCIKDGEFITVFIKGIPHFLECFNKCLGICSKSVLDTCTLVMMLQNGALA